MGLLKYGFPAHRPLPPPAGYAEDEELGEAGHAGTIEDFQAAGGSEADDINGDAYFDGDADLVWEE